jgi:hypothetical protein
MFLRMLCSLALIGAACNYVNAQPSSQRVDPSGSWRFEYDLEGQTVKDSLYLQLGKDGAITGTYRGRSDKAVEISSGKIDGDKIVVEMKIEYQGFPVDVKFDGKIKGDDIDGLVIASTPEGEMDFDWIAKRSVEVEDVLGIWELEIDAVETVLEPTAEFKLVDKELKGHYKDTDTGTDVEITNIRIEKNIVKFSITANFQGADLKANFEGRPYGNKISGTIEYDLNGETGEVEFEGVRKAPKTESDAKKIEKIEIEKAVESVP